jgi:glycosyltransferase involved in cell wall biosynthesis
MMVDMAPSEVPTLVFAGRIVWQVADLMTQMENTNFLDRKIMLLPSLSDFELRELYRGCLFTVFPSFYEGWGLPVTESLAFGKPCVASNKTSIPEAGGKFARYFDPDNGNEAYDMIRGLISDRTGLAAWEADIRENFRPTSWNKGAETILVALGMDFSVDPGAPSAQHVTQSAP